MKDDNNNFTSMGMGPRHLITLTLLHLPTFDLHLSTDKSYDTLALGIDTYFIFHSLALECQVSATCFSHWW